MRFSRQWVGLLIVGLVVLAAAVPAAAQTTPSAEVSGGYQFLSLSVEDEQESLGKGWYVDLAGNLSQYLGIVFEVGGNYRSITRSETFLGATGTATVDLKVHQFMGGVRVSARPNPTVVPFGQVLVGGVNGSFKLTGTGSFQGTTIVSFSEEDSGTNFGLQAGGGVNLRITDRIGVRAGVDYLRVFEEDAGANVFRFAAGIVLPFPMR